MWKSESGTELLSANWGSLYGMSFLFCVSCVCVVAGFWGQRFCDFGVLRRKRNTNFVLGMCRLVTRGMLQMGLFRPSAVLVKHGWEVS